MSIQAVLAPVFAQVALTFLVLFWMGRARLGAIRAKEVKVRDIALGQRAWPARPTQIANTYHNQFETPVLFYALVALALITQKADLLFVVLAWLYVLCRLAHAAIYTTSNNIAHRFSAFLAGSTVLMLMWIIFAARVLIGA